jgi:RNA polymerase sigma factor (sigma-70 family)
MVARGDGARGEYMAAVDQMVERLASELGRHRERRRAARVEERRTRRRASDSLMTSLSEARMQRDREPYVRQLGEHMAELRHHVHRELVLSELAGAVRRGELTADDVIDEVVARSWDHFDADCAPEDLDRWMMELIHDYLDERAAEPREAMRSIDEPVTDADHRWMSRDTYFHDEAEPEEEAEEELAGIIPDEHGLDPLDLLTREDDESFLLDRLAALPRRQRRAFTLYTFEEWTVSEIATMLRSDETSITKEIEAARGMLRRDLNMRHLS